MKKESFQKLVLTGVFAALSYVVFTFLQIKIPLPGGDATSIHLGNAVCVLGALILGGLWGGIETLYLKSSGPAAAAYRLCVGRQRKRRGRQSL